MKIYIIIAIFLTVLISCNSKFKQEDLLTTTVINNYEELDYADISKTITKIFASDLTLNTPYLFQVLNTDTGDIYINYNFSKNSLDIFNITDSCFVKQIFLEKEGPNKIIGFDSFYYASDDSILFQIPDEDTFIILNLINNTVSKKRINNSLVGLEASDGIGLYYYNNRIVTRAINYGLSSEEYKKENKKLLLSYNIKKESIDTLFCNYPNEYEYGYLAFLQAPYVAHAKNTTYVSFPFCNNLYEYDLGELKNIYEFKSKYINNFPDVSFTYNDEFSQRFLNFFVESPYFLKILYNPYNNKIYKISKFEQELYNTNGKLNGRYTGKWSVLILDLNELKIKEIVFPKKLYNFFACFVTKNGLSFFSNETTENTIVINSFDI